MDVTSPLMLRATRLHTLLGIICLILGIATLIWPEATLLIVAWLFGLQLIAAGAVRLVAAITLNLLARWWRVVSGILGALTVIAGVICIIDPGTSLLVIAVVLAVGWLLDGVSEIISGFTVSRRGGERLARVLFGAISIIAAVVVLIYPGESLQLLAMTGGVILIIFGVILLASRFLIRERPRQDPARVS